MRLNKTNKTHFISFLRWKAFPISMMTLLQSLLTNVGIKGINIMRTIMKARPADKTNQLTKGQNDKRIDSLNRISKPQRSFENQGRLFRMDMKGYREVTHSTRKVFHYHRWYWDHHNVRHICIMIDSHLWGVWFIFLSIHIFNFYHAIMEQNP